MIMAGSRAKTTVRRIYDQVNLALWAGLVGFAIFCAFVIVPQMPRYRAEAEAARANAREQADALYCKRWGFAKGSAAYLGCMSDLLELRRSIERQLDDEAVP